MVFNKKLCMENILKIINQKGMRHPDISQRMLFDMKTVFKNPGSIKNDSIYYTVYRNLEILGGKIRYDITVLPQKITGGEFTKTFGHYHESASPELYEVLEGNACFLLQRYKSNPKEIMEAYIIDCAAGEKAIMPPGFGHLSVNIGKSDLVLANWIGLAEYDYGLYKNLHGGCYYILDNGNNIEFEKNPNYTSVPKLKKIKLRDLPDLGIKNDKDHPIWDLKNDPKKLDWLTNPVKYMELLKIENLYKEI